MRSAKIMFAYAGFLVACGLVAFFMAPEGSNANTALIFSIAPAVLMVVCGMMANAFHSKRTVGMIGIHLGLVLTLIFAGGLGWRAFGVFRSGDDTRYYLGVIMAIMAVGSLGAFFAIMSARPPKTMRT